MLKDNQITISAANDIDMICQPLFANSKISHFEFMRMFSDKTCIWLTSNAAFVKKLSSRKWSRSDKQSVSTLAEIGKGYQLWSTHNFQLSSRRATVFRQFNIDHGLTIKESYQSHQDYFIFATQSNNFEIYQYYANNFEFINKFIFYFKDKASPLIKQAMKQKILIPIESNLNSKFKSSLSNSQKPIHDLKIDKYIFTFEDNIVSLSVQELKSTKLLARGYTIKEIGKFLNISPRTVEYYIKCAREKMHLNTNRELISIYWQSTLTNLD